jgi:predicted TPR repeat methyltransferase
MRWPQALRGIGRRLRWSTGRGWRAQDFAARYAQPSGDVWGYAGSPEHLQRAEWILSGLPAPRFRRVLEVGCAQGFLTERLAQRADSLIACDFSPDAVDETKRRLAGSPHVECRVVDIREGFPGADFDLCLFSDVLYYLSKRETDLVLAEAAARMALGGFLVIASEWRAAAKGLTDPAYGVSRLDAQAGWTQIAKTVRPFGSGEFVLAAYRRAAA